MVSYRATMYRKTLRLSLPFFLHFWGDSEFKLCIALFKSQVSENSTFDEIPFKGLSNPSLLLVIIFQ